VTRVSKDRRAASGEAIFIGAVETQMIEGNGRDLRLLEVHFKDGARNKMHAHTTDQLLVITEGEGIVATRSERREVGPGDVAFIPAGEEHWHGAKPGKDMTHLAINGATSKTDIKE
jgi:quercetin dioxygenase-like cupin family protein